MQASKAYLLHGRRVLYHWATREVILTVECTYKGFSLKYLVLNLQKWQSIRKVKCFWWVGKCFPSSCGHRHWRRWKENMFMVGRLLEHKHWTEWRLAPCRGSQSPLLRRLWIDLQGVSFISASRVSNSVTNTEMYLYTRSPFYYPGRHHAMLS